MELPVIIVATVLTLIYGFFISKKWYLALAQGAVMLVCVLLCGRLLPQAVDSLARYPGAAQIIGIFAGSVIVFIAFGLPARSRSERRERERDIEAERLNEEDE